MGPQERDDEVGVVPAHALPGEQGAHGSVGGQAGPGHIAEVPTHPGGDAIEQLRAGEAAEFGLGRRPEMVGLAVPARPEVTHDIDVAHLGGSRLSGDFHRVIDVDPAGLHRDQLQPGAVLIEGLPVGKLHAVLQDGEQLCRTRIRGHGDGQDQLGGPKGLQLEMCGCGALHAPIVAYIRDP